MKQFKELKNGQWLLNDVYEKFELKTHREIKKDICDALWAINHFISLNEINEDEDIENTRCIGCTARGLRGLRFTKEELTSLSKDVRIMHKL